MAFASLRTTAGRLKARFERAFREAYPAKPIRKFIRHNRRKYPERTGAKNVVLVGLHHWNPSIYLYSLVANYVGQRFDARLETFGFAHHHDALMEKLYRSFGATPGLTAETLLPFRPRAGELADEILGKAKTKWDILNISLSGIRLGDLIYDTYLRHHTKATIDLENPQFRQTLVDAIAIQLVVEQYLDRNNVVAIFPDHTVYIHSGILVRMAFQRGIPVYMLPYNPNFYILQLDPQLSEGMPNVTKRWSYYRYREMFDALPEAEKVAGRARARQALEERLSGKIDAGVLVGHSAYAASSGSRLLAETDKPKVLVFLHDFCDSVHCFREMLFPDFYEWAHHLLGRAAETEFEWYVKPHPNSISSQQKNVTNAAVVEELKRRYPRIHLIDASASNRQLVEEGVCAAYTVHGTVAHELAYLGVPVVNAGDNLHVSYGFNLNPSTVADYDDLIARSDKLGEHPIDRTEIEEFYYMHYFYFRQHHMPTVNPFEKSWLEARDIMGRSRADSTLAYFVETETPEKQRALQAYFDDFFEGKSNALGGAQWATIGNG